MEDHLHFFSKRELNFFIFELDIPRPDMKFQFDYSWMVWLSGRGKLDPGSGIPAGTQKSSRPPCSSPSRVTKIQH